MSKKKRFDTANPPISELAQRAQPQETTMEAPTTDVTATVTDPIDAAFSAIADQKGAETVEDASPAVTAKMMAAAEEQNAARAKAISDAQQKPPEPEQTPMIELAAKGIDALHEALRQHGNRPVKEYTPPPRTQKQMQALQEELEAGRRARDRAKEQAAVAAEARAKAAASDRAKEGFTTPVYRPNDVVPHPLGGMGQFGAGAVEEG